MYLHLSVTDCSLRSRSGDVFWLFMPIPKVKFLQHTYKSLPHGEREAMSPRPHLFARISSPLHITL